MGIESTSEASSGLPFEPEWDRTYGQCRAPGTTFISTIIVIIYEGRGKSVVVLHPEFLTKVRQALFLPKNGCCIPSPELNTLYHDSQVLNGTVLVHVVHCANCLDQINQLRGLPTLSERQADNGEGRERPPQKAGGNGGPPNSSISARTSRRLAARPRDTFEHLPQKLRICVNGIELCEQSITAALNELRLTVNFAEKVTFVEIYSELRIRLLFMDVEAFPDGPMEQTQRVHLSDGRTLKAVLRFTGLLPVLEVIYEDPVLESKVPDESEAVTLRPILVPRFAQSIESGDLFALLARLCGFGQRLRAGWMTAATAIVLAIALLIYEVRPDVVSAAELLDRSIRSEQANAPTSNLVLRRSLNLQEFAYPSAIPISHHRIEVWQSPGRHIRIRRLFDDNNHIVAEERIEADGTTSIGQQTTDALLGLRVENLYRLSHVSSELENQVRVERTRDGHMRVVGEVSPKNSIH